MDRTFAMKTLFYNILNTVLFKVVPSLWAYFGTHLHKLKNPSNNLFKILNKIPR
jgi:hypothetical protein